MANLPADILVELEEAVAAYPPERCARIFSGIVQLLASGRNGPQQLLVDVVDRILLRLTGRVAPSALAQFGQALAELDVAPQETLRKLASHEDPEIADPVLSTSPALSAADLVAIATSCDERHQLAIAARNRLEAEVTEALLNSGTRAVWLALIKNPGTNFSDAAYAVLLDKSATDDEITKALALRPGTPDTVLRKLLASSGQKAAPKPGASAMAPPRATTSPAYPAITPHRPSADDYARARSEIIALSRVGKLNDSTVNRFAIRGETANLFTALSVLSGAPVDVIEDVLSDGDCEGLVMACRASRLNWQTTLAILSNRGGTRLSFAERERAQQMFETLLLSTSQWTVRWGEIAASAVAGGPERRSAQTGMIR